MGLSGTLQQGAAEYVSTVDCPHAQLRALTTQAYWQRLYLFVRRHALADEEAQDIVQQTFLEALQCAEHYNGQSSLGTWLHGIAKNLVRHHVTRTPQRRYAFVGEDMLQGLSAGESACPIRCFECAEQVSLVDSAWQQLPVSTRQLLEWVALDDMSYECAAEKMSIPVGTVRSRVSRARSHLRASAAR